MKQNNIVIGLTGGVGSGKTTVMHILKEKYGVHLFIADEIGHLALNKGEESYDKIIALFGSEIIREDASLDREKIASMIFKNPSLRKKMNEVIHPFVWKFIQKGLHSLPKDSIAVIESAILFDAGYEQICDAVWCVVADESARRYRLKKARKYSYEKIHNIMQNQTKDSKLIEKCNEVIKNDGDIKHLENEIDRVFRRQMERFMV